MQGSVAPVQCVCYSRESLLVLVISFPIQVKDDALEVQGLVGHSLLWEEPKRQATAE